MIRRHHQSQIEGTQRLEVEIAAGLHVRGEQQIELAAEQGMAAKSAEFRSQGAELYIPIKTA